jgi:histidinol phosphatase-like enzyme (inositol monophosphatase family)
MDLGAARSLLVELAHRSGDFILPFCRSAELRVETKADATPVTEADRGAEALMRQLIQARFPEHGILGEEYGPERTDADWVWVLDPIDGTKSFVAGVPLWGTLIALLHQGQPVLGAIHQPLLGELMIGDGQVTTLNDRPVRVRPTRDLAEALFLTTDTESLARRMGAAATATLDRARLVRTWGDCYGYLLLAAGRADVMLDPIMNPWDIAALVPIVRGAGGVITDRAGQAPYPAESTLAATTPELHAAVLAGLHGRA